MATIRDVLTLGLRRARVLPSGSTMSAEEADDGLKFAQSYYDSLFALNHFGVLTPVTATADYTAEAGDFVYADGFTISLPSTGTDLAAISIMDSSRANHIFSGLWQSCSALTLDSYAPLSERSLEGLACAIMGNFSLSFGSEATDSLMQATGRSFTASLARFNNLSFEVRTPMTITGAALF